MNNEPVFTDTDQKICNLANRYLESRLAQSDPDKKYNDIALPNNKDILTSGHSLYDITRILENTMNEKLNPNKIVPEWLWDMSFDDIKSFHQRVTSFSNLQYDYAYKLSQNIITNP